MGRFNWDWAGEGPPDDAYERVTEPERFTPLHDWTLEAVGRLQAEYDVALEEGKGVDAELERSSLARPTLKLTPRQESCAPITIAFTDFPGLAVRVGRWVTDYFPAVMRAMRCRRGNLRRLRSSCVTLWLGSFVNPCACNLEAMDGAAWNCG